MVDFEESMKGHPLSKPFFLYPYEEIRELEEKYLPKEALTRYEKSLAGIKY